MAPGVILGGALAPMYFPCFPMKTGGAILGGLCTKNVTWKRGLGSEMFAINRRVHKKKKKKEGRWSWKVPLDIPERIAAKIQRWPPPSSRAAGFAGCCTAGRRGRPAGRASWSPGTPPSCVALASLARDQNMHSIADRPTNVPWRGSSVADNHMQCPLLFPHAQTLTSAQPLEGDLEGLGGHWSIPFQLPNSTFTLHLHNAKNFNFRRFVVHVSNLSAKHINWLMSPYKDGIFLSFFIFFFSFFLPSIIFTNLLFYSFLFMKKTIKIYGIVDVQFF